jgi:transcriptional regulator with XRE-family HTH domain
MKAINGEELALLRAKRGTQEDVADLAGVSVHRISEAERNLPIPPRCAKAIARVLNKAVDSLFREVLKASSIQAEDTETGSAVRDNEAFSDDSAKKTAPQAQSVMLARRQEDSDVPDAFRKVFGSDPKIFLIYSELTLNRTVPKIIDSYGQLLRFAPKQFIPVGTPSLRRKLKEWPLVTYDPSGKHGKDGYHFRAEHSACVCEVRAAAYLSAMLSQFTSPKFRVVGNVHADVHKKADLSFVSFGTLINSKTHELLADPQALVGFQNSCFVSNRFRGATPGEEQRKPLHKPVTDDSKDDYGAIIRIRPTDAPAKNGRVWIACAGVQQVGTSGAAWVLANRWEEIAEELKYGNGRFACLVKVPKEKGDEFAHLEWVVERPEDLDQHEL